MNATSTMKSASATEWVGLAPRFLADLAGEFRRTSGVELRFYLPDGRPLDLPAAPSRESTNRNPERPDEGPAAARIDDLMRRTADIYGDRVEVRDGWAVAAFPLHRRRRVMLVAVAACPVASDADLAGRLMAAVIYGVRTRVESEILSGENVAAVEALSQSYEEVNLLHGLGEVLLVSRPVHDLLQQACDELRDVIGTEVAAAYLPEIDGRQQSEVVVSGRLPFDADALPGLVAHMLDSPSNDETVVVNNHCQDDPTLARLSADLRNVVVVPLPLHDHIRGGILAANRLQGEFGSPDAKLIRSIAGSGAVFIENHRLYRELREMMFDLVRALVSSVDAKDPYTCGHSERVAITAREIAREMGLTATEADAEEIYLAGLLHDIGKIGTPESILLKPGRLDPEERRIVCLHPTTGGRILDGIRKLERAREVALYHHERFDGSGYPSAITGTAIPPLARIVSLADAFDAMTSNRPYRPTMPLDRVLEEIRSNRGAQFDPDVVDAFFRLDLERLTEQLARRSDDRSWVALQ